MSGIHSASGNVRELDRVAQFASQNSRVVQEILRANREWRRERHIMRDLHFCAERAPPIPRPDISGRASYSVEAEVPLGRNRAMVTYSESLTSYKLGKNSISARHIQARFVPR